jgi:hypothetical protein
MPRVSPPRRHAVLSADVREKVEATVLSLARLAEQAIRVKKSFDKLNSASASAELRADSESTFCLQVVGIQSRLRDIAAAFRTDVLHMCYAHAAPEQDAHNEVRNPQRQHDRVIDTVMNWRLQVLRWAYKCTATVALRKYY